MKQTIIETSLVVKTNKWVRAAVLAILSGAALLHGNTVSAQGLSPFSAVYYQNPYLSNPAMAGMDKGLNLNLGIRQQWATMPGSPKMQVISADYDAGKHVGLGLNVSNDQAGLLRQTRAVATYAYHVQLGSNNQQLNFGLSAGVSDQRINYGQVQGDEGDVQVSRYNQQRPYLDGDFGASYTSEHLIIQGAIPNLNHFFKRNTAMMGVDQSVFFTSLGYRFMLDGAIDGTVLEPKVVYRGVYGYKDVIDAGLNLSLRDNMLHFYSMYHSSQSESLGFGANISKSVQLMLFYTTQTQ